MPKAPKTNVIRFLTAERIPFDTLTYDVSDGNYDGTLVAGKTGVDPALVFKTLVLTDDGSGHLVCVVPAGRELDLKAVARASGHKSVAMLPQKELLPLTGYLRGGCSPLGMKKHFPTWLDQAAESLPRICVSAGVRGCMVILPVSDLIRCTGASLAPLCRSL